jgi:hypothetical protein
MITKSNEQLSFIAIQTDDEKAGGSSKALMEPTASRPKMQYNEVRKSGVAENPEVGCVPWYRFPEAGK